MPRPYIEKGRAELCNLEKHREKKNLDESMDPDLEIPSRILESQFQDFIYIMLIGLLVVSWAFQTDRQNKTERKGGASQPN